jgi:hypothetical protein
MTAFETLLRIRHDCPFIRISERHASMRMYTWCNRVHEVMEVVVDEPGEYEAVLGEVSKLATVLDESSDGGKAHLITSTCFCTPYNSVGMNIEDLDILDVSPVVLSGGWEYYRVIAFRHEDLAKMLERLEARGFTVEVLRKTPFEGSITGSILATESLFSELTGKQTEALIKAYGHGYYQLPRTADIQEIAVKERVARTTFQEHLKKGENKIIGSLMPYLQLYRTHQPRETDD